MACVRPVGLTHLLEYEDFVLERDDVLVSQKRTNVSEEPPPPFLLFRSVITTGNMDAFIVSGPRHRSSG
jgi:hypothetical protein